MLSDFWMWLTAEQGWLQLLLVVGAGVVAIGSSVIVNDERKR